jgi:hypothetical protein
MQQLLDQGSRQKMKFCEGDSKIACVDNLIMKISSCSLDCLVTISIHCFYMAACLTCADTDTTAHKQESKQAIKQASKRSSKQAKLDLSRCFTHTNEKLQHVSMLVA